MGTNWNTDAGRLGEPAFTGADQLQASLDALKAALNIGGVEDAVTVSGNGGDAGGLAKRFLDNSDNVMPSLWTFASDDLAAAIDTTGYFNDLSELVAIGDLLFSNTALQTTNAQGAYAVKANSGGVVDVSNISSFGLANTD